MADGLIPLPHKHDRDTFVHLQEHNEGDHPCRYCDSPVKTISIRFTQLVVRPDILYIADICPTCLDELAEVLHGISHKRRSGS